MDPASMGLPPAPPLGGQGGPLTPPGVGPAGADAYRMPESFIAELQAHNVTADQWNALSDEQMWNVMASVTSEPADTGTEGMEPGLDTGPQGGGIPPAGPPAGPGGGMPPMAAGYGGM